MREMCKSGAVVAAVVAVLEKQNLGKNSKNSISIVQKEKHQNIAGPGHDRNNERSTPDTKNIVCLDDDGLSFESAVKDFDNVAEDVLKFCSTDSFKRRANPSSFKTDSLSDPDSLEELSEGKNRVLEINNHVIYGKNVNQSENGQRSDSNSEESSEIDTSDSEEEKEHLISEGLATITEELSAQSGQGHEDDSSLEDDSTLKGQQNQAWSEVYSNPDSTSDLSSTSSEHQSNLRDSSTRCNSDFQWIRKEPQEASPPKMEDVEPLHATKPPLNRSVREKTPRKEKTTESLDRRKRHQNRIERDQKARSSHILKSPPRLDDYTGGPGCQNWCCNPHDFCYDGFQRRHERYGSNPMLERDHQRFIERGSHPDIYGDFGRYRHDMQCCSYHMAPIVPQCYVYGDRNHHWSSTYPKSGDLDEKFRKIQYEKDNLQLQVQVLSDQIEAQSDKISDLEKMLHEKKQLLSDTEDKLQREMLSRSSLETQKLELMSIMSELKLQQASLERENLELRSHYNNNAEIKKPPVMPRMSSQPTITSSPVQHISNQQLNRISPSPSPITLAGNSPRRIEFTSPVQQETQRPKTPPANYKRQIDVHYGSLPRQQFLANGVDNNANPAANGNSKKGVAFGRGFYCLVGGRHKGFSVPNLAETEKILIEDGLNDSPGSPNISFNKSKGIKKIFGKIKRSGSGNLEDIPGLSEFQRGGVRATASARLGWSEPQIMQRIERFEQVHSFCRPDKPFSEWDTENICDWLQDLGLDIYVQEAKRWVQNGQQLQEASISEIEKELNIKNPLHRKKLQLALIDTQANGSSDLYLAQAGKLDTAWVLRWLDDTGLPQHKENFLINRVDGRVLHRLTIDDLALLHVTSMLHVASIKRGIQVLRENNYEPGCLQRRSLPDDPHQPSVTQISLWTTHRVMEWLRAVDLAEYAPNLRGAGVHGGLMVLEPKFNAELLAALLAIPSGKTLLRRHLNTHFNDLLGKDVIQEKRECESTMGHIPLTPALKLKIPKKSQFSLKRKKSKGEADYGDLVCPLNPDKSDDEDGKPRGRGCLSSR